MAEENLGQGGPLVESGHEAAALQTGQPWPLLPLRLQACVGPLLERQHTHPPRVWDLHSAPRAQVLGLMWGRAPPEETVAWPPAAQDG